ncbi:MAG: dihydropteroate synthase [Chitinispirillaceae bacterium]|nr:dihydropteroate synthase [Chitinispirillaceae bacterium]
MNNLTAIVHKRFAIMGIVNSTPDSFYDGGRYSSVDAAFSHAMKLIGDGAAILDIGGASSRPGASPVTFDEEIERVLPVIKAIRKESAIPISVDTTWSKVAEAALESGADWINDISAGRFDSRILSVVAKYKAVIVLMHSRGTPQTMQENPGYQNVLAEVITELWGAVRNCFDAGISTDRIILDPGIGFGKTFDHNCTLMREIDTFCKIGFPVLVGTSRKSFIGKITGREVEKRLPGSLGSIAAAYAAGVKLFRVHDVAETSDFLKVLSEIGM